MTRGEKEMQRLAASPAESEIDYAPPCIIVVIICYPSRVSGEPGIQGPPLQELRGRNVTRYNTPDGGPAAAIIATLMGTERRPSKIRLDPSRIPSVFFSPSPIISSFVGGLDLGARTNHRRAARNRLR